MTAAVLLDVDGTLVDSNYLHVDAWVRAFRGEGIEIDAWQAHRALGLAGPELIARIAGQRGVELDDDLETRLSDAHAARTEETAHLLRPFDGAVELVRAVADAGARPVLATSSSPDTLERLRDVLGVDDVLHAVTSSQDVDASKPAPDLLHVALDAAGVSPEDAVMVGDAVWDAQAAVRAGVPCVAVLSGGIGEGELLDAGAVEVHDDVAALLASLGQGVLGRLLGR